MHLLDALTRQDAMRWISTRHEQTAGHMADGFARGAGRPAVCMASRGPGAANLVIAMHNAFAESVPVLAVIGQVDDEIVHRESFEELDMVDLFRPVTKWALEVHDHNRVPELVARAAHATTAGRRRPVMVSLAARRPDPRAARACVPRGLRGPAAAPRARVARSRCGGALAGAASAHPRRRRCRARRRAGGRRTARRGARRAGGGHVAAQVRVPRHARRVRRVPGVRRAAGDRDRVPRGGRRARARGALRPVHDPPLHAALTGLRGDPGRRRPGGARARVPAGRGGAGGRTARRGGARGSRHGQRGARRARRRAARGLPHGVDPARCRPTRSTG